MYDELIEPRKTLASVQFYDISLDGEFIDRIYANDLHSKDQVYLLLMEKGYNPKIKLSEAY